MRDPTSRGGLGDVPRPTRFLIVGIEVVVLGAATILGTLIAYGPSVESYGSRSWAWWFIILGVATMLVGLEAVALVRQMTQRGPGQYS